VYFDIDADGVPEKVSWTDPAGDEAFLAMDRNGNGMIDDGSELFGNYTPTYLDEKGKPSRRADNGFEALKYIQLHPSYGASTRDELINAGDEAFKSLLLWNDANHNGISEPEELTALHKTRITAISTEYRESKRVDQHGNEFRLRGHAIWDIRGHTLRRPIFDIWLKTEYDRPATTAADGQQ
jgi:hypothetical protein